MATQPKPSAARSPILYQAVHIQPERHECPSGPMLAHYGPQIPHQAVQNQPEESEYQSIGQGRARYDSSALLSAQPCRDCHAKMVQLGRREHFSSGQVQAGRAQPCHLYQEAKIQSERSECCSTSQGQAHRRLTISLAPQSPHLYQAYETQLEKRENTLEQSRAHHSSSASLKSPSESDEEPIQKPLAPLPWPEWASCPSAPSASNVGSLQARTVSSSSSPPDSKEESSQTSSASSDKKKRDDEHRINEKKRRDDEKKSMNSLYSILDEAGVYMEECDKKFPTKKCIIEAATRYIPDLQAKIHDLQAKNKKFEDILRWLTRRFSIPIPLCIEDWDEYEDSEAESGTSSMG